MILMVVLALLTLFAVVGITFVYVANSQETSARIAREAETQFKPQVDPEAALALFLGQFIYGVHDDTAGVLSALRAHDLGRNMYGWYHDAAQANTMQLNDKPYSGTGRLHANPPTSSTVANFWTGGATQTQSDAFLVNYQYFLGDGTAARNDGFLRDPGRVPRNALADPLGQYIGGDSVPYTYPDHNNFFLAQIDPNSGQVITPSFHREYLFGRLDLPDGAAPAGNPNWSSRQGKYLTVRPTRVYHPNFPMPLDRGGDVKNLDGAPGGADSIWIDIGAPVMTAPDGRKYKMLVAPLIIDLCSRMNINVVGNWLGTTNGIPDHRSNQGWGPWEINPGHVLNINYPIGNAMPPRPEWLRIFEGTEQTGLARVRGRYDQDATRGITGAALTGGTRVRNWGQVDYNGMTDTPMAGPQSSPYTLPLAGAAGSYHGFPNFPAPVFGNGGTENNNHPAIWKAIGPPGPNRRFTLESMARLLRYGGTNSDMLNSDLTRLLPDNLHPGATATAAQKAAALKRRHLITLLSADLDRPGIVPYTWNSGAPDAIGGMTDPANWTDKRLTLRLDANNIPTLAGNIEIPFPQYASRGATPTANVSDFDQTTWRSTLSRILRVRLNRILPRYDPNNAATSHGPATQARQSFAREIFNALRRVTGAMEADAAYALAPGTGQSGEFRALRYLAQLAVNIVDFIDDDHISTPFQWHSSMAAGRHWVFGTELPRLLINEAYAQYDNERDSLVATNDRVDPTKNFNVNLWLELMNPVPEDPTGAPLPGGTGDCTARLQKTVGTGTEAIYRIRVVDSANANIINNPANTRGDPDYDAPMTSRVLTEVNSWPAGAMDPTAEVKPMPPANRFNDGATRNTGFYVAGPKIDYLDAGQDDPLLPTSVLVDTVAANMGDPIRKGLNYTILADTMATPNPDTTKPQPIVLLQRLANPDMPHDNNEANPTYNPYITVDVVELSANEVMDGRRFLTTGNNANHLAMDQRKATGRRQPYAGATAERIAQAPNPALANKPQHTFARQNSTVDTAALLDAAANDPTLKLPFDWLPHLDRLLVSPMELLHVSAHRPADLTKFFVVGGQAQRHTAAWMDSSSRLHRFFEMCSTTTEPRGYWGRANGRIPGLLNINGLWKTNLVAGDPDLWKAVVDPQGGNAFADTTKHPTLLDDTLNNFLDQRTPVVNGQRIVGPTDQFLVSLANDPSANPPPGGWKLNKPFWGFGVGYKQAASGDAMFRDDRGAANSFLRTIGPNQQQFDVPDPTMPPPYHPYQRKELLNKIYNSITPRSNVFAVWVTVGFFEVEDDTQTPPRLGREIGKAENRHTRYRMFSIVDRTHLQAWPTLDPNNPTVASIRARDAINMPMNHPTDANGNPAMSWQAPVVLIGSTNNVTTAFTDTGRTDRTWNLADGAILVYEPGTDNEETVVARPDGSGGFVADFSRTHPANCTVISRGNPGPWRRYDPRKDTDVVPYFALID